MVGMAEDFADLRRLARDVLEALEDPDSDLVARIDALGGRLWNTCSATTTRSSFLRCRRRSTDEERRWSTSADATEATEK